MLSRRPTSKILSANDHRVLRLHGIHFDVSGGIEIVREPDEGVATEFFVFVGLGWDEGEVLGRDDLIRVDVLLSGTGGVSKGDGGEM